MDEDYNLWVFGRNSKLQCLINKEESNIIIPTKIRCNDILKRLNCHEIYDISINKKGEVYFKVN